MEMTHVCMLPKNKHKRGRPFGLSSSQIQKILKKAVALSVPRSNPFKHYCSLAVQLICISLVALLLAIFQPGAFVVLQHAVFTTVVSVAETAVADDALRGIFAVLETASDFPRGHATAQGQGDVDGG